MTIISGSKLARFIGISIFVYNFVYCKNYCQPEFCNNLNIHTLCKYKLPGPSNDCFDYEKLIITKKQKQDVLNKLNSRRNKIASGEIRSLSSAENMIKLLFKTNNYSGVDSVFDVNLNKCWELFIANYKSCQIWNEELELFAQRWADQCVNSSENDACRDLENTAVGQNVATVYGEAPGLTASSLVDLWYMELFNVNASILNHFTPSILAKESYDYFTQLAWADTREVGCGAVKFKTIEDETGSAFETSRTVYRLVCNFAPRGNRFGLAVYHSGVPCSQCPVGSSCDIEYNSLCALETPLTDSNIKNEYDKNHEKIDSHEEINKLSEKSFSTLNLARDNETNFDFLSYLFDVTKPSHTITESTTKCKEMLAVDEFLQLLKSKLSNDQQLKELLLSTSTQSVTEPVAIDETVAAIVNQLYTKKETTVTCRTTKSDNLNSTILADLIEAVIFRHSDKYSSTAYDKINTELETDVGPVKIQAELAQVKPNLEFTGHYFFPEDEEQPNPETTESYDETENLPISEIVLEIEEMKRSKVTKDFIDSIFESDFVVSEFMTSDVLPPIDNINGTYTLNNYAKDSKLNKRDVPLTKRKRCSKGVFINYSDLLRRLATDLGILKLNERFNCAHNFARSLKSTGSVSMFIVVANLFY